MTRDEIISMAQQVTKEFDYLWCNNIPELERFAALVAARERAACFAACQAVEDGENGAAGLAWECVDAIRERAQIMRNYFYKRERRWHEPKDDATQTEWLALVFAVGCLVVLWVIGHWWSEGF